MSHAQVDRDFMLCDATAPTKQTEKSNNNNNNSSRRTSNDNENFFFSCLIAHSSSLHPSIFILTFIGPLDMRWCGREKYPISKRCRPQMRANTELWRHRCRRSDCGRERVHMIRIFSSVNTLNHRHTTKYIIMEPAPRCCEAEWSRGWQAAIMITCFVEYIHSHQCNPVIMFETNVWQIVGNDAVKSTTAANEIRNQCRRLHAVTVDVFFFHRVYHQFPYENVVFSSICWDYKWHLTRSAEKNSPRSADVGRAEMIFRKYPNKRQLLSFSIRPRQCETAQQL